MKRTLMILTTVLTLSLAGVLYGNHSKPDNDGTVSLEEAYTAQFPETIAHVIPEPMIGLPLY